VHTAGSNDVTVHFAALRTRKVEKGDLGELGAASTSSGIEINDPGAHAGSRLAERAGSAEALCGAEQAVLASAPSAPATVKPISLRFILTSVKLTLDVYAHSLPGMHESAVEALEAAF
jgi:hypothetical protein